MISAVATIWIPPKTMNTPAWIATACAVISTDASSHTANASRLIPAEQRARIRWEIAARRPPPPARRGKARDLSGAQHRRPAPTRPPARVTPSASTCNCHLSLRVYQMVHEPDGTLSHGLIASPGTPPRRRRRPCPRRRDRRPEPAPDRRGDRHQPPDAHLPLRIPRRVLAAVTQAVEEQQRAALLEPGTTTADHARQAWRRLSDPSLWPQERLFFELYAYALRGRPGTEGFLDGIVESWVAPVAAALVKAGADERTAGRRPAPRGRGPWPSPGPARHRRPRGSNRGV